MREAFLAGLEEREADQLTPEHTECLSVPDTAVPMPTALPLQTLSRGFLRCTFSEVPFYQRT